ncbi:menaquinol-cytochrome c reductase cytochrome b/c subunit [Paenibacillus assamensis]|uniref:menaquinol-cytochrome c reductase cytochrome b/c subunit n=1 Tax=Paenibacillus assamensis TaxID=311244 RepID=UPI00042A0AF1|nr:menaquinol-cytochrome c reductase cytochrome b/c subunit [Paenibacillus assamensis]
MAHGSKDEKVVYVGDSRVKKKSSQPLQPDYSSYPGKSEAFIPNFLLKEWMVGAVVLVGFLVLTISEAPPLGYPADPNNAAFIPIPDWYFLFLYQLLKYPYAAGDYVLIGTVLIPGIAFGGLMLAPFLDTGKERRFYKRPIATSLMLVSLAACVYLTVVSWDQYQHELEVQKIEPEHHKRVREAEKNALAGKPYNHPKPNDSVALVAADDPAMETYKKATCIACHGGELEGGGAPALLGVGDRLSKEEILTVIKDGRGAMPPMLDTSKSAGVTEEELDKLADWLAKQKKE